MKAKKMKSPPGFVPIGIVLETKDEADLLWHLLNQSNNKLATIIEEDGAVSLSRRISVSGTDFAYKMWDSLDKIHRPTRDC